MSLLTQIEQASGQIIATLETTPSFNEVLTALGQDISIIFPSVGQTITTLDDIISVVDSAIHEIASKNASTATTYAVTPPKPVTALTLQEKALLDRLSHISTTNEMGQHVVGFLEPIAQEVENATQFSITKLEELSTFLKNARNQQHAITVQPVN